VIETKRIEIPSGERHCQPVMKVPSVSITRHFIEHRILNCPRPTFPGADKSSSTVPQWFALRDKASLLGAIGLWQATCICCYSEWTGEMQTQTIKCDPCMNVSAHQSAVLELKQVLSLRLPSFYRCALRVLGNAADAEDAVQEALLAAYRHIGQFRGQAQMSTWLTTIVRNCALMQLRKRPGQIHLPLDEQTGGEEKYLVWERLADTRPSPEDECRKLELVARLQKCATLLSPTLRRTFQLRVLKGLSIFETARILGVPHGTVKAQLARARAKIARHMRPALAPRSRSPHRPNR
jgi:RNA polymerase sigma-70 factor (ECF subfamily)